MYIVCWCASGCGLGGGEGGGGVEQLGALKLVEGHVMRRLTL